MVIRQKPKIVPITSAEFQLLVTPAHCMAKRKQMTAAMIVNVPGRSICFSFSSQGALTSSACREIFGVLKVSRIMAAATPLRGKLM